jgi:hypothetical protein
LFEFTGADYGVYFGNIFLNFVAKAFDQASGDYQSLRFVARLLGFEARHFEDGVDRFLLRAPNEGAGVDYDHVGVGGVGGKFGTGLGEHAHHHFAVDQVLGAAEAYEANFWGGGWRGKGGRDFILMHWDDGLW